MTSKRLYQWTWDWGRMGELSGVFVATEEEVANAVGKYVYFGEVLGKHSEVAGTLEASEFTLLEASPGFVEEYIRVLGGGHGFNPLDYIRCENCHEEANWCECDDEPE